MEATMVNNLDVDKKYSPRNLVGWANGSEQEVWAAMAVGDVTWRGQNVIFSEQISFPGLGTALMKIRDPKLALLASSELVAAGRESSFLNDLVREHNYSEPEIDGIKPDLYGGKKFQSRSGQTECHEVSSSGVVSRQSA